MEPPKGNCQPQHIGFSGIGGVVSRDLLDASQAIADGIGVNEHSPGRGLHRRPGVEEAYTGFKQLLGALEQAEDIPGQCTAGMTIAEAGAPRSPSASGPTTMGPGAKCGSRLVTRE